MVSKRTVILGVFSLSVAAAFAGTLWNLQGTNIRGQIASGTSMVVDDGDAGFTSTGQGWQRFQHSLGYQGDILAPSSIADKSLSATWTFSNVTAGQYKFFVTFKAYSLLTNKAPFTMKDGATTLGSSTVNQKTDPSGNAYDGKNWVLLGTYTVKGPTVSITLSRPEDLTINGVIADSARIERVAMQPMASGLSPTLETTGTNNVCRAGFTRVEGGSYPFITCSNFCGGSCNAEDYYLLSGSTACCKCGISPWCASSSAAANHEAAPNPDDGMMADIPPVEEPVMPAEIYEPEMPADIPIVEEPVMPAEIYEPTVEPAEPEIGYMPAEIYDPSLVGSGVEYDNQICTPASSSNVCAAGGGNWDFSRRCCICNAWNMIFNSTTNSCDCPRNASLVTDPMTGQQGCCPNGTSLDCTYPSYCTCEPIQCPPGFYVGPNNTCMPLSVCGDGYLEREGSPREICETGTNEGCAPGRTCIGCTSCGLCGNTIVERGETCEADYSCASGSACQDCLCTASSTHLTANMISTLDSTSPGYSDYTSPQDTQVDSWTLAIEPQNTYDVYVKLSRIYSDPCPIISYWRVYDGSRQVRPLNIEYGNYLCSTWPGNNVQGQQEAWVNLGKVVASSSSLRIEHVPPPTPVGQQPTIPVFRPSAVRVVKQFNIADPAPIGVTLIDNGDLGFRAMGGTWKERSRSMPDPSVIGPMTNPLFDDDIVLEYTTSTSSGPISSWSFTVSPGRYRVLVSYGKLSATNFINKNAIYSIRAGTAAQAASEVGRVTVDHSYSPNGPMYRFVTWKDLGTYTVTGNRLSVVLTNPYGLSSDAIRIEQIGGPGSSAQSSYWSATSSQGMNCSTLPWLQCTADFQCLVDCSNGECTGIDVIDCPIGTVPEYTGTCGNDLCRSKCARCIPVTTSSRSSSSAASQALTCNTPPWQACDNGFTCLSQCPNGQCLSQSDIDCQPGYIAQYFGTCGNFLCEGKCARCLPGTTSSRSSAASSAIACAREGEVITELNLRLCCDGLSALPNIQPDANNQCSGASLSRICGRCGDNQCGTGENFCNCPDDCPRPICGDNRLDTGEQCDGLQYPCPLGQVCTNGCQCATQPPSAIQWETVGDSYLISTLSDYALFGHGSYLYLVGGMGFWGTTRDELRSTDGLSWSRVASLPQSLSNTAYWQDNAAALLVGGLTSTSSAVDWALETTNLQTAGFQSSPKYTLPSPRSDGALLRMGSRTYYLGGYGKGNTLGGFLLSSLLGSLVSQTISSTPSKEIYVHDGTRWTRVQPDLPFSVTENDAFTIGNRLFIIDRSTPRKVYSSSTGTSWSQVATLPSTTAKSEFLKPIMHKGAIWLIGTSGTFAGSAVATTDGLQWVTVAGAFPANLEDFNPDAVVSFQDEIWLLGSVADYYAGGNARNGKVLRTGAAGGPFCGDGHVLPSEQCDDGNTIPSDGCSNCQIDSGWTCTGSPSRCTRVSSSSSAYSSYSSAQSCAQTGQSVFSSPQFGPTTCCSKNDGIKPSAVLVGDQCVEPNTVAGTCVANWWQTCGDGTCSSAEDKCTCEEDCFVTCTPAGKTHAVVPNEQCCSGLVGVNPGAVPQADGQCPTILPVGAELCTNCGNGTCEQWENYCNCAKDCLAPCAQNGERVFGSSQFGPTTCCSKNAGIKPNSYLAGGMCVSTNDGSKGTCIDYWWQTCGNGLCGNGEDQCSCPVDCAGGGPTCGNGGIEGSERCDDGNKSSGDGCSYPACLIEDGWTCSGMPSKCSHVCPVYSAPYCPNGVLVPQLGPDKYGCQLPPVCCNGAQNPSAQCSLTLKCSQGSCVISSCSCK